MGWTPGQLIVSLFPNADYKQSAIFGGKMTGQSAAEKGWFWRLWGRVMGATLVLVLGYALLFRRFTPRGLSDALCSSALWLGLIALVPLVVELGRGVALPGRVGGDPEAWHQALITERQFRRRSMNVTFVLVAAALVLTVLSFILSAL